MQQQVQLQQHQDKTRRGFFFFKGPIDVGPIFEFPMVVYMLEVLILWLDVSLQSAEKAIEFLTGRLILDSRIHKCRVNDM